MSVESPCIIDLTADSPEDSPNRPPPHRVLPSRASKRTPRSSAVRNHPEQTSQAPAPGRDSAANHDDCIVDNDTIDISDASIVLERNIAEPVVLLNNNNNSDDSSNISSGASQGTKRRSSMSTPTNQSTNNSNVNNNQTPTTAPLNKRARGSLFKVPQETPEPGRVIRCPICLDNADQIEKTKKQKLISTICGHIFCEPCIKMVLKQTPKLCPQCRTKLTARKPYHDIFI